MSLYDEAAAIEAAKGRLQSERPAGVINGGITNPYARDKRVAMNQRVPQSFPEMLDGLSRRLQAKGLPKTAVSRNELLMMTLHYRLPTVDEAVELVRDWTLLKASPAPPEKR